MKYIVAASGGVDSMVLLDMMMKVGGHELVVAHFDHGIRPDSHKDATLVADAAKRYGLRFESTREELGETASEALARDRRYNFLRSVAKKHGAAIVTAHHLDDLVETVAINITRGTGWRGVAVFDSSIVRPLLDIDKATLLAYAKANGITWSEDETNSSTLYLRNRVRQKTHTITTDEKRQLRALHAHQRVLKRSIESEVVQLVGDGPNYSRYLLTHMSIPAALECLRVITQAKLTRPQLARLLNAIKVSKAGSGFEAGNGVRVHFTTRQFSL